ncbi:MULTISPECIES: hypothetical protein [unclassified Sinorhizobium]|uniref:hypothetical protein n=1 Tax=unclassified Sinorhizobium TaxID=2613772 RepID=UPI0035243674
MKSACRLACLFVLATSEADAHAFAQRYDLPLPLWHYIVGAGAAVLLSFLVTAVVVGGGDGLRANRRLPLPRWLVNGVRRVLGGLALAVFLLLLLAGFFGAQEDWDSNLLPVSVWVVWWVGVTYVSALVGGVWPLIDPWRAAARIFPRPRAPLVWPGRVGAWPAVFLFLAFAWCELAWTENAVPGKLATLILAYSLLTWMGMALFSVKEWCANADPFAVFFGLIGRFAAFDVKNGALVIRPFGAGLSMARPPTAATAAFVIVALATVSFDGIRETPFWDNVVGLIMRLFYDSGIIAGIGYTAADSVVKTLGLLVTPLVFAMVYLGTCALVGRIAGEPLDHTARRYVLSFVPIALGYHLAHYLSYLLIQGQAVWPLLSDPLNLGWDLFGTRHSTIDIGVIGMRFVWLFAVLAIVLGHVAAVMLAHQEALRKAPSRVTAVTSQAPMVVLMVAYTMLSLWILSQPVVEV